jgi:PAS domain-containing protein
LGSDRIHMETSMNKLAQLITASENRLMQILHAHSIGRGYCQYTSTLEEAWRTSISVLSDTMIGVCESMTGPPELSPEMDYRQDPIAQFGITQAQKHRERGISIDMFLGLLKYYRQSYMDLIHEADFERDDENKCRQFVDRFYDRIELGLCKEWLSCPTDNLLEALQAKNRMMTNEKNKYLTVYESLPHPAIFINNHFEIENMNHAAMRFFHGPNLPGSYYYDVKSSQNPPETPANGHKLRNLLPWLDRDIHGFAKSSDQTIRFERKVTVNTTLQHYDVAIARMLDVSQKFAGLVIVLTDITEQKAATEALEEERRRLQQALEEVRTLQGIVPICAYCKNIRDDAGYWSQVEQYISKHSNAEFSHGICPECFKKEMMALEA